MGVEPAAAQVTNDYRSGSLTLGWELSGVGIGFAGEARFTVDCTLAGASGSVFHADLSLTPVPGQTYVQSGALGPIPVGASCGVVQHLANGADSLAVPVRVTGTTATVLAELANEYSAGTLTVSKKLTGAGARGHKGDEFAFAVTCALTAGGTPLYSGELRVTGARSATVLDGAGQPLLLPAGTHCWAQETEDGGAQASTVDHASFDGAVVVTPENPDTIQDLAITVTNRFGASAEDVANGDTLAFTGMGGWAPGVTGLAFIVIGAWLLVARRRTGE